MTLPSKKIIPVIIACIVAGGTITYAATFNNNDVHAQQTAAHLLVDTSKTTIPVSDDVWQNTLATVEPGSQQLVITATTTPTVPLNSTQLMAHNLISSYLSLKQQNNGTLSDADQQDLAQQIVTNSAYNQLSTASSTSYFSNDIKITTDDNDAAVRAYGNAVATAIINNVPKNNTDTEMSIVDLASTNQDQQELDKLQPIIASYQNTLTALLKIPTPPSAETLHLNTINDFSALISIDERLANLFNNPTDSLYALKDYETSSQNLYQDFQAFGLYFSNRNITFGAQEKGGEFYKQM